jgi:uncharacterized membrane protein YgcG
MRRSPLLASLALPAACLIGLMTAGPAAAHHGWEEYDTTVPYYLSGTVTEVRWGNPHPEVTISIDQPVEVPADWAELDIPAELEDIGGREVLEYSRPYDGGADEMHLALAPIERLAAWGMDDEVEEGEVIEAVGYIGHDHDDELRPELIVRPDGQVVRQRSVPLPTGLEPPPADEGSSGSSGSAGSSGSSGSTGSAGESGSGGTTGQDPATGGTESEDVATADEEEEDSSSAVVWTLVGLGVLVVAGSGFYVVRRGNQG